MSHSARGTRRRALPRILEVLEPRSLLSTASPTAAVASFVSQLPAQPTHAVSAGTPQGSTNPSGVAVVPRGFLVTDTQGSQGGAVVKVNTATNTATVFYQGTGGQTPTGAVGVMREGFAFVGIAANAGANATANGSILILDRFGNPVGRIKSPLLVDGPSAIAVNDRGDDASLFVANAASGTVVRIDIKLRHGDTLTPAVTGFTKIGSGFAVNSAADATGQGLSALAYDPRTDTLYVASAEGGIAAIANASRTTADDGTGKLVSNDPAHVVDPTGLALSPDGDLLVTEGAATGSSLVELTRQGTFVDQLSLGTAAPSGLALKTTAQGVILGTADDTQNTLDLRLVPSQHKGKV